MAMTISVEGVLLRAADTCNQGRHNEHLVAPLGKLVDDLNELYLRRTEPKILDEFFGVWSVNSMEDEQ